MKSYIIRIICVTGFLVCCLLYTGYLYSQEKTEKKNDNVYTLDRVVITAKKYESAAFNTALPVNIIDAEEIDKIQAVSTGDLLRNQAGVDISQTGMGTERPMIRGLYDSRVLILVDGIKLSEQRAGGDHALSIDPSQVERIEIVRGPGSVLYGSEAIGGVINFITKKQRSRKNDGLRFEGYAEAGYDSATNGLRNGLLFDGGYNQFNFSMRGNYKTTGDIETPEGKLDNSSVTAYNYSGGCSYAFGKLCLAITGTGSYADIEVPTFSNDFKKARFEGERHHAFFFNSEAHKMSNVLTDLKVDAAFQRHSRRMRIINASDQRIAVDVDFDTFNFNPQAAFSFGENQKIITGFQSSFESEVSDRKHPSALIDGVGVIPPSNRLGMGLFAQDEISLSERFTLTCGFRYDWFRSENKGEQGHPVESTVDYDSSVSGNVGMLFALVKNHLNLTGNIARAFRAPTLHERYFFGPHQGTADYGNPDIDPETSWNFDAGLKVNYERIWVSISGFYNRINDYIEKRLTGGTTFGLPDAEFANVSKAELYGGEVEAEIRVVSGFTLSGNLCYVKGRNISSDQNLSSIPPVKGTLGMRYEHDIRTTGLWSEFIVHAAAEQSNFGENEDKTDGYITMDIRAGIDLNKSMTLTLYCKNLTDKAYHDHLSRINSSNAPDVDGLEQPGRSFGGGIKVSF